MSRSSLLPHRERHIQGERRHGLDQDLADGVVERAAVDRLAHGGLTPASGMRYAIPAIGCLREKLRPRRPAGCTIEPVEHHDSQIDHRDVVVLLADPFSIFTASCGRPLLDAVKGSGR
jgi:hypothetical protein